MATVNAARHFRVDHLIGAIAPGRLRRHPAVRVLEWVEPQAGLCRRPVGRRGQAGWWWTCRMANSPIGSNGPSTFVAAVHPADFVVPAGSEAVTVRVIEIVPDQITNYLRTAATGRRRRPGWV